MKVLSPDRADPKWVKPLAWGISFLLIVAAVVIVIRQRDSMSAAIEGVKNAPLRQLVALLVLPVISVFLTAAAFWQTSRKHGKVGYWEMFALIGSAWVLNLLPLKPGLIGRVGYHARYNAIGVPASIKIVLEASGAGLFGVFLLAYPLLRDRVTSVWIDAVFAPLWIIAICGGLWGLVRPANLVASFLTTSMFRMVDAFAWTLRYGIILQLLGLPPDLGTAFLIAAAAQAAMYVPLVGNGLGVREWAVGSVASVVGNESGLTKDIFTRSMPTGLSIDLLNRAAEMLVLVPLGLGCCGWVARLVARNEAKLVSAAVPVSSESR